MHERSCIRLGALLAGLAVALGAFGAHAMKDRFDAPALQTFETAVRYQMYHALALLLCGVLAALGWRTRLAALAFAAGTLLFSGSLYAFVFSGARWVLPITPVGGTAFVVGWIALLAGRRTATDGGHGT